MKKYKYFVKLWDNEKIEIDIECYNKLENGTWISVMRIEKIGLVTIPLENIKLWYRVELVNHIEKLYNDIENF